LTKFVADLLSQQRKAVEERRAKQAAEREAARLAKQQADEEAARKQKEEEEQKAAVLRDRVQAAVKAGTCPVMADILAGVSQDVEVRQT
jgi:glutamyl/glutaminyl-tRNA synthetase